MTVETVNILSYSIETDAHKNILSVNFLINQNKPLTPKDYELVYQSLVTFCEKFMNEFNQEDQTPPEEANNSTLDVKLDISGLDEAQVKADKLSETLNECWNTASSISAVFS